MGVSHRVPANSIAIYADGHTLENKRDRDVIVTVPDEPPVEIKPRPILRLEDFPRWTPQPTDIDEYV